MQWSPSINSCLDIVAQGLSVACIHSEDNLVFELGAEFSWLDFILFCAIQDIQEIALFVENTPIIPCDW